MAEDFHIPGAPLQGKCHIECVTVAAEEKSIFRVIFKRKISLKDGDLVVDINIHLRLDLGVTFFIRRV